MRYEQDADGIVTLTLDDPTVEREHHERRSTSTSMGAAVDRLGAEKDDRHRRRRHLGQEDVLRRRQPEEADRRPAPTTPPTCSPRSRASRPSCAGWRPSAGRSWPRSTAPRSAVASRSRWPATTGSPSTTRGPSSASPRSPSACSPAAAASPAWSGCSACRPALMDVLLTGTRFKPAAALEKGLVDELVADRDELVAGREGVDPRAPRRRRGRRPAVGPAGLPDARRHPVRPRSWPRSCRPSRPTCASRPRARDYPAPRAILSAAVEGAQVDFDTASRIESRYLTKLVVGQNAKNMIQAFFFDLQAINSGSLRPEGVDDVHARPGRRARRRDDGRRHRLLRGPGRHRGGAQGRQPPRPPRRARRYSATLLDKAVARGRMTPRRRPRVLARITPTADAGDLAGCDMRDRGGLRGPGAEGQGVRRGAGRREPRRAAVLEHLDAADHRARRRACDRPEDFIGHALLLARRQDAARRDHPGREDLRRDRRPRHRRRPADQEDPDRGQRQPRLLHLAGLRHAAHRGGRAARGGRRPADHRAGGDAWPASRRRRWRCSTRCR